jgi:hypothetical protein
MLGKSQQEIRRFLESRNRQSCICAGFHTRCTEAMEVRCPAIEQIQYQDSAADTVGLGVVLKRDAAYTLRASDHPQLSRELAGGKTLQQQQAGK